MLKTRTLIIGGGLAGLSAAKVLEDRREYIIAEREDRPGGLAATVKKGGFSFDYSGHLLHLRWPETSRLILNTLGANRVRVKRDARVFAHNRWTPFPFQANLSAMPDEVKSECLRDFLKAYATGKSPAAGRRSLAGTEFEVFTHWTRRVFGRGISRHFMLPYNAKLWQYPLNRLTTEWCAPFVPVPKPEEIINGAYGKKTGGLGYNAFFYYPRRGGIAALSGALARQARGLRLGLEVESVNLTKKTARIRRFGQVAFRRLINTSRLDEFIAMTEDAPESVRRAAASLRYNTVYVLNLGVKGVKTGMHWGYFPNAEFPFYRAGIATNFSKALAPRGCAAFYIEIATGGGAPDLAGAETEVLRGLKACGLIKNAGQIMEKLWLKIPCAYVIYNRERAAALPLIFGWLGAMKARSIGRYGAWKYSFMEESVKEGLEAGRELL